MTIIRCGGPRQTYGDYCKWPEDRSGELVDGVAYVREPPAPTFSHQEVIVELCQQVRSAIEDKPLLRVCSAPLDVRLPKSNEGDDLVDTVVQPDVFIVSELHKVDERGVRGAPTWLAEVLSPSTARYDRLVKVPVYERAGVREVWLIHPQEWQLTLYKLEGGRYSPPKTLPLKGRMEITAVPGITVDWDRIEARLWFRRY